MARIVMRLFSLADMAERSVRDLPWVRWCVLWAAWQANTLLKDYLEGTLRNSARRTWTPVLMPAGFGSNSADAQDIAASLRAFGLYMQAIGAQLCRLSFLHQGQASNAAGNEGGLHCAGLRRLADAVVSPVQPLDTS